VVPCNQQKGNADVLRWCEFKGYKPAKIVYDLLEEDRKNNGALQKKS